MATVFESLFQSALDEYEKQTGINLVEHPLAAQLDGCDSVDSITEVLQEQARSFREFRGSDNKIMKSLRRAVQVLHKLSGSVVIGEAIGLVRRIQ
jgi:fungal STAND N-terminal Goodbye domain